MNGECQCCRLSSFVIRRSSYQPGYRRMIARTGAPAELALRVVNSVAPIRICDNGGWTDTWFAGHGKIFNIGVYPYVEVQIAVYPRTARPDRVRLRAENYGADYAVEPGGPLPNRHP